MVFVFHMLPADPGRALELIATVNHSAGLVLRLRIRGHNRREWSGAKPDETVKEALQTR